MSLMSKNFLSLLSLLNRIVHLNVSENNDAEGDIGAARESCVADIPSSLRGGGGLGEASGIGVLTLLKISTREEVSASHQGNTRDIPSSLRGGGGLGEASGAGGTTCESS
ncbi:uncharacterized protein [Temnothorax nylanderi]|uniref:uncharacterized protein n=1 Tax=Temnothorax nylanderi TaxID=102681 RepID=UPI003A8B0DFB